MSLYNIKMKRRSNVHTYSVCIGKYPVVISCIFAPDSALNITTTWLRRGHCSQLFVQQADLRSNTARLDITFILMPLTVPHFYL